MFVNDLFKNNKISEGFDDLDRFMKAKYGPKPSGGSGIKRGTYGQPGRRRGRPTGATGGEGSGIPQAIEFDRPHSERSAGRRLPRFSDDYDAIRRSEVDEGSAQDRLHRRHQELRKKSGLPDPDYYKELRASYDIENDQERQARQAEIKKKYRVAEGSFGSGYGSVFTLHVNTGEKPATKTKTKKFKREDDAVLWAEDYADQHEMFPNLKMEIQDENGNVVWELEESQGVAEGVEQYLEEMRRAGYDIVTEAATLCPECGGPAYNNQMLAEKQDACYHKVKSRYKVWPSAYASGALVRCRKVGAKNWGNKSKK
jgi:hypothetical protein